MAFSERNIGFSTGALAKGDFRSALSILKKHDVKVVELSALRDYELPELISALPSIDVSGFSHVSIHAPSKFTEISEHRAVSLLEGAVVRGIGVIVHPDTITDARIWEDFGDLLWIENLDKRKPGARTTSELESIFERLPNAGFCLDLAHARQIDPTMSEAARMLDSFRPRLRQIHASGLNSNSTHTELSAAASFAISQVSHLIPREIPIVLESPVQPDAIRLELEYAKRAFSPWSQWLQSDIDDVLCFRVTALRRRQLESFLKTLLRNDTRLRDFERVIGQLPTGGSYNPGDAFQDTGKLLHLLSTDDTETLRAYLHKRVEQAAKEFPDLAEEFKQQFM